MQRNLLALDQSSHVSGYAVFKNNELIKYGHFNQNESDVGERLAGFRKQILLLIQEYQITEIAFEDIQLQNNHTNNVVTFKVLAEVFGVIHELCVEMGIKYSIVHSQTWKSELRIGGRTRTEQKKNAQLYVQTMYDVKPTQDEADAICIGASLIKQKEKRKDFQWE